MSNRFKQAWDMAKEGALHAAAEMLVFGDNEQDYKATTQSPLFQNADFWDLIDEIGLSLFGRDDFKPGEGCHYDFQDANLLTLRVDVLTDRPVVYITLQGRTIETCLVIKQHHETKLFQLDDAFIAEKGNSIEDPEEYDIAHSLLLSHNDNCPDIAQDFLSVLADVALLIKSDTDRMSPQELEVEIFKQLKPIIDRIRAHDEKMYAEYERQTADMPSSATGQPTP